MAIANMGQNNYVRKPNPFEVAIINRLNRFFNTEFTSDPNAPETLIVEIYNRLIPIVRTTVTQEAHKMAMDSYHPADIQAILADLEYMKETFKDNEGMLARIIELKEEVERLLGIIPEEPPQEIPEEPDEPEEPGEPDETTETGEEPGPEEVGDGE